MDDSGVDSSDRDVQAKYFQGDSDNSSNDISPKTASGDSSKCTGASGSNGSLPQNTQNASSCRVLQKKLQLKVERAKKNYSALHSRGDNEDWDVCVAQPKSTNLIAISRLQYPGRRQDQTLIEYREVNSGGGGRGGVDNMDEEDMLSDEEAKFFASKHKKLMKQDLTDTFSIQEMTIESDSHSESGSDTLELLPPPTDAQYWEKLGAMLPCCSIGKR